jgi:hypothetical protein
LILIGKLKKEVEYSYLSGSEAVLFGIMVCNFGEVAQPTNNIEMNKKK